MNAREAVTGVARDIPEKLGRGGAAQGERELRALADAAIGITFCSLFALGVADDPNHPDIFHYTANIAGPHILAGVEYWFTVANFAAGWQWAQALNGPTVGWENFNVHRSTGIGPCADGGPHCGPWVDTHTDTAFRFTVPEPGSLALVGLTGLMALGLRTRRREPTEAGEALPA